MSRSYKVLTLEWFLLSPLVRSLYIYVLPQMEYLLDPFSLLVLDGLLSSFYKRIIT